MQQQYNIQTAEEKNQKQQLAVNISDTPVTLKQSQGHQTYNENVDPNQGYDHAKLKRSRFNSV